MNRLSAILIASLLSAVACGGGTSTEDVPDALAQDVSSDTAGDATGDTSGDVTRDGVISDDGADVTVPPSCIDAIANQDIFQLFKDEGRFIVQVAARFDGEAIWMAWSAVDQKDPENADDDLMTIRAARFGCDGTVLVQPFTVDPDNAGNSYEADIAIAGGKVFIAWHQDYQGYFASRSLAALPDPRDFFNTARAADDVVEPADVADTADTHDVIEDAADVPQSQDTTMPPDAVDAVDHDTAADAVAPQDSGTDINSYPNDNMRVYYRSFKVDGTPVMSAALRWLPTADLVNNWIPRVTALPDGRFVIAATWAAPGASGFQVVAQRFNADGTLSGDLIQPYSMPDQDEQYGDVVSDSQGNLRMAWGHSVKNGEDWLTSIASIGIINNTSTPQENSPVFYPTAGAQPSLAITPTDTVFTAYTDSSSPVNVVLVGETSGRAATGTAMIGNDGPEKAWNHVNPVLESSAAGTILLWYRWTTDKTADPEQHTDLMLKKLAWNGTGDITAIGSPVEVNAPDATRTHNAQPYYPPAVTHLGQGWYFIMWSEPEKVQIGTDDTGAAVYEWQYKAFGRFLKP